MIMKNFLAQFPTKKKQIEIDAFMKSDDSNRHFFFKNIRAGWSYSRNMFKLIDRQLEFDF